LTLKTKKRSKKKRSLKINSLVSITKLCLSNFPIKIELKKNLVLLEKASKEKDFKMTASLTKNLKKLRKMYELPDAVLALSFYMPDLFMRIQLPTQPTNVPNDMKLEEMLHCTTSRSEDMMACPEA
jgi:hypothetical protein